MAIKFPDFKFIAEMDAKARVFFLFAVVLGIGLLVYIGVRVFGGGETATGPSKVANAPQGLQSVPGSQLSPEYYRALVQANAQAAQKAQLTGGSAVPTLINIPGQNNASFTPECSVVCPSEEMVNVDNDVNNLVRQGKLSQEDANRLLQLSKNNATEDEYATALNDLVRQGKLTPEQARQLLNDYQKQHKNNLLLDSAKSMDPLVQSGQLSLAVANDLLAAQKKGLTPAEYANELDRLVREGKISPEVASQLLAQYTQQHANELAKESGAQLKEMVKSGQITPETAATIAQLQSQGLPVDQYQNELAKLVNAGKLTPATAAKLLEQYRKQRLGTASIAALQNAIAAKESECDTNVDALVKAGRMSQGDRSALHDLASKNVPSNQFQTYVSQLVADKKLAPADAESINTCYQMVQNMKTTAAKLMALQGNNATLADYTAALKNAVQSGAITPEMAAQLLREYQAAITPIGTQGGLPVNASIPGASDFAKLQQRVAAGQAPTPAGTETQAFSQAAQQAEAAAQQATADRIQSLMGAMTSQASQLISAWQPVVMQHQEGTRDTEKSKLAGSELAGGAAGSGQAGGGATGTGNGTPPVIKAGTILFAILDTAVDSDYPDTPVMATIVEGEFKGAKLLGKMASTSSAQNQQGQDKVSLTFNLMNMDAWTTGKTVNAFAIDPDTARTVLASSVNYHYMLRYGSLFATSFLSGYASAVQNSGATNTTSIFGSTTGNATYSPLGKIAIGLGQVGTALSSVVSSYSSTPPTVKVNAGVGLGILFMADVTQ